MNINPNAPLPKDKLSQLIDQNLADLSDALIEGSTPEDFRNLITAQTTIAYEAGREIERIELLSQIKGIIAESEGDATVILAGLLNKLR